jgi:hypothetical protein
MPLILEEVHQPGTVVGGGGGDGTLSLQKGDATHVPARHRLTGKCQDLRQGVFKALLTDKDAG